MQVTINLTYSTCVVTIKQKRKNSDGSHTYRGISERGTVYQFTDKQIIKEEI